MGHTFIYNAGARGGRIRRFRSPLKARLDALLPGHQWVETDTVEEARRVAAQAGPDDVVVALGGDGSVHVAVEGLARSNFRAALGIIPIGTGNDFAFGAGIPPSWEAALEALVDGRERVLDVGEVSIDGGPFEPFVNAVGVGFDAAASIQSRRRKWLPGVLRYLVSSLETLRTWQPPATQIDSDDHDISWGGDLMFATIGNAPRSGGGFLITPDAVPDDGLLDTCIVEAVRPARAVTLIPKVMQGTHGECPETTFLRGDHVRIRLSAPAPVHADGEILTAGAWVVEAQIRPGCLRVVSPGGS